MHEIFMNIEDNYTRTVASIEEREHDHPKEPQHVDLSVQRFCARVNSRDNVSVCIYIYIDLTQKN